MSSFYRWQGDTLLLLCHLQPKASKDEFAGLHGERVKIRITAPPVDGKANQHLCKFIAQQFGVSTSQVSLVSGATGRQKTLAIAQPKTLPAELDIRPCS